MTEIPLITLCVSKTFAGISDRVPQFRYGCLNRRNSGTRSEMRQSEAPGMGKYPRISVMSPNCCVLLLAFIPSPAPVPPLAQEALETGNHTMVAGSSFIDAPSLFRHICRWRPETSTGIVTISEGGPRPTAVGPTRKRRSLSPRTLSGVGVIQYLHGE